MMRCWPLVALSAGLVWTPAHARQGTRGEAVLVVDGVVREVFRSARRGQVDYLVQIDVKRSELGQTPRERVRVFAPTPGEALYVHATDKGEQTPQRLAGLGGQGQGQGQGADAGRAAVVPAERTEVRAYLVPRAHGGWEGTGPDWFEATSNRPVASSPGDPPPLASVEAGPPPRTGPAPAAPPEGGKTALSGLGMTGEGMKVQDRFVVKVVSTERGGPAQRAGLEPGDIIVAANERELTGIDQLEALARQGGALALIVVDVNSGRGARVNVDLAGTTPAEPGPRPESRPSPPKRSLGFSAEPVSLGLRTGMKVITVEPGSVAHQAGLEPGDVIVAVNETSVTNVESLAAALRKSGPDLRLKVRDVNTGRDAEVKVDLGGQGQGQGQVTAQPSPDARPGTNPPPAPVDPRIPGASGRSLGVVGEVVFLDTDSAVKVTEVTPGSPAQKAGIEPGDIILEANGTPILHPNTLNEVVAKSDGTLSLVVIDPKARRKTTVEVDLGR